MNNKINPLVTIGIPVYNEEKYIEDTLLSVKNQNYFPIEIIISDNLSSDDTPRIIQEICGSDQRFKVIRQKHNIGSFNNFLYVLNKAKGDFFIWVGGHDKLGKDLIEKCVKPMVEDPTIALVVAKPIWIDSKDNIIRVSREYIDTSRAISASGKALLMYKQMDRACAFHGLHRIKVLKKTLPWPKITGFDFNVLMQIASLGNIKTEESATWYRRIIRTLSTNELMKHQIKVLKIKNLPSRFPLIYNRYFTIKQFLFMQGSFTDRFSLVLYAFKRFFNTYQIKFLIRDLNSGLRNENN